MENQDGGGGYQPQKTTKNGGGFSLFTLWAFWGASGAMGMNSKKTTKSDGGFAPEPRWASKVGFQRHTETHIAQPSVRATQLDAPNWLQTVLLAQLEAPKSIPKAGF